MSTLICYKAYDTIEKLRAETSLPMTVLVGARALNHVAVLRQAQGIMGPAAGSLSVFQGRYRAVLINYHNRNEKAALLARAGWSS